MMSEKAKIILKHFRDKEILQGVYEYPAVLERLFESSEECEKAQEELYSLGLLELGRAPPAHIPVKSRVRSAALTLSGERFLAANAILGSQI